ncbi:MbeB family mobilization protein, partial [Escherichia coli]|nr:MbeB family mobilization protein [Escherichia coli]
MSNLLQTGAEFEKKLKERAESTEKMLNDEFRKLGESVSEAVTSNETKIRDAIALFTASTEKSLEKHAYSALFDHGLASKSDQRFAYIRSTG